jgi:hypothetical protein
MRTHFFLRLSNSLIVRMRFVRLGNKGGGSIKREPSVSYFALLLILYLQNVTRVD